MTIETFKKLTRSLINLETVLVGRSTGQPTSAIEIINCIRHWKFKPQIPIRALFAFEDGNMVECRLKDELGLWKVVKMRGMLNETVKKMVPSDFWAQL